MIKRASKEKNNATRTRIAVRPHEIAPVPIVGDGAVATGRVLGGRLVPVLILDTSDRPDIEELIRVHRHMPPGDAASSWGRRPRRVGTVVLLLESSRPSQLKILLEFDIASQSMLVDFILRVRAVYLQSGTVDDRVAETMEHERLLIEVPDTGFEPEWEEFLRRGLSRDFRRRGLSKREARQAARRAIGEWRRLQGAKHQPWRS